MSTGVVHRLPPGFVRCFSLPRGKGRDEKGFFSFLWSADDEYTVAICLTLARARN